MKSIKFPLLSSIIVACIAIPSFGQIGRGTIMLGGSFMFRNSLYKSDFSGPQEYQRADFNFVGKATYFLTKNLSLGLGYNRDNYFGGDLSVFSRYYVNGKLITGFGYGINQQQLKIESGYAIFLKPYFAVEPTLYCDIPVGTSSHLRNFGANFGLSFFLNRMGQSH